MFQVLDRVRVKIKATDSFPMDVECKLFIAEDDIEEYNAIL
jgi:hypothetical protein